MSTRGTGWLSRLLSAPRRVDRGALFLDLAIIGALADGEADDAALDALAACVTRHPELTDHSWDSALARAQQLYRDAPLFADARQRLKRAFSDPEDRKNAFELAAAVAASARPLGGDARAVLHSVGAAIGIGARARRRLIAPFETGASPPAYRWQRTLYSDPEHRPENLFQAIAAATPEELPLLLYKLEASFRLLQFELGGYALRALGPLIQLRRGCLRLDAHYSGGGHQVWSRFMGPQESLHPVERRLWEELLAGVEPPGLLVVIHSRTISPRDLALFTRPNPRLSRIQMN